MMFIPVATVLAMKQQYATLKSDAHEGLGYNAKDPVLRAEACQFLGQAFAPYPIHPDDISITCSSLEGTPGSYFLIFRATWDPRMDSTVLLQDEQGEHTERLPFPQSSVTRSCGMRTWVYELAGFDTDSRLYVFSTAAARTKEKVAA